MLFSFFKRVLPTSFSDSAIRNQDAGPTVVDIYKMSIEERKNWRQSMVRRSIKETFHSLEILSGMYRYRIMPLDDRGHYYIVMFETTRLFASSNHVSTLRLAVIGEILKNKTFERYGIIIDDVYWKPNESVELFKRRSDTVEMSTTHKPRPTKEQLELSFSDTLPMQESKRSDNIQHADTVPYDYDPPTDEEAAAFRAALADHRSPPPMIIGDQEYFTDLAPLGLN